MQLIEQKLTITHLTVIKYGYVYFINNTTEITLEKKKQFRKMLFSGNYKLLLTTTLICSVFGNGI